eukprot:TRINITY_DN8629_c0_g1_i2.p1 TRINITY_DN8629_c0_g1~~TRINITY_DN8629_c0_g1_i2.p1  ORF type:complete len:157 (-),score=8.20 TRINITY_DN8629_c0_g1_i2:406-876(-)
MNQRIHGLVEQIHGLTTKVCQSLCDPNRIKGRSSAISCADEQHRGYTQARMWGGAKNAPQYFLQIQSQAHSLCAAAQKKKKETRTAIKAVKITVAAGLQQRKPNHSFHFLSAERQLYTGQKPLELSQLTRSDIQSAHLGRSCAIQIAGTESLRRNG